MKRNISEGSWEKVSGKPRGWLGSWRHKVWGTDMDGTGQQKEGKKMKTRLKYMTEKDNYSRPFM